MKNKKYFLVFICIFLIIIMIGLIPYIDGVIFKKNYDRFVDVVNKEGQIKIDVLNYHRGWFNSYAKIRITINKDLFDFYQPSTASLPLVSFIIEENIIHGPIVYDRIAEKFKFGYANIESNIFLTQALQQIFPGMFQGPNIMYADMLSEFDGDWSGHVEIRPFTLTLQNIGNITAGGINSNFKIVIRSEHIKHVKNDLSTGPFIIDTRGSAIKKIIIQPIQYNYDVLRQTTGLWSGNSKINVLGFTIIRSNEPTITSNELSLQSTFSVDKNTFHNTNLYFILNDLKIPDYFIPYISRLRLIVIANDFSTKGLNDYIDNFSPDFLPAFNLNNIETALAHTVTTESDIYGSINLISSLGNITTKFKTHWRPNVPAPNNISNIIVGTHTKADVTASKNLILKLMQMYIKNWGQFTDQLMGKNVPDQSNKLNLKNDPENKITKTPQQSLTGLEQIGYISKDKKDNYSTEFTIVEGVPKINGRSLINQNK